MSEPLPSIITSPDPASIFFTVTICPSVGLDGRTSVRLEEPVVTRFMSDRLLEPLLCSATVLSLLASVTESLASCVVLTPPSTILS